MTNTSKPENANVRAQNTGQDAKGRFAPGNPGGPGNPFSRQVAALREEALSVCTKERLQRIMEKMMDLADAGSIAAAKFVYTYAVGKPQKVVNPDHMDIEELDLHRATAPLKAEAGALGAVGSPEFHLRAIRTMKSMVDLLVQQQFKQMVERQMLPPEEKAKLAAEEAKREEAEAKACEATLNQPVPADDPLVQSLGRGSPSPSTNGEIGAVSPIANGENGRPSPIANGRNGKKRWSKQQKLDRDARLEATKRKR